MPPERRWGGGAKPTAGGAGNERAEPGPSNTVVVSPFSKIVVFSSSSQSMSPSPFIGMAFMGLVAIGAIGAGAAAAGAGG